jgi:hypothetical protein
MLCKLSSDLTVASTDYNQLLISHKKLKQKHTVETVIHYSTTNYVRDCEQLNPRMLHGHYQAFHADIKLF